MNVIITKIVRQRRRNTSGKNRFREMPIMVPDNKLGIIKAATS